MKGGGSLYIIQYSELWQSYCIMVYLYLNILSAFVLHETLEKLDALVRVILA